MKGTRLYAKYRSRLIFAAFVSLLIYSGMWGNLSVTKSVSNPSLVSYWKFDENNGDKVFDLSGNNNTGNLSNTHWSSDSISGSSIYFNGDNSSILIDDSESLDVNEGLSIVVWIKGNSFFGNGNESGNSIIGKWKKDLFGQYQLTAYSNGSLAFRISDSNNSSILIVENILVVGVWYNIAATWDQESMTLFINGSIVAEQNTSVSYLYSEEYSEDYLQIGADNGGDYPYWRFDGVIDEVSVFNQALSAEDILEVMESTVSLPVSTSYTFPNIFPDPTTMPLSDSFSSSFIISTFILLIINKKRKNWL